MPDLTPFEERMLAGLRRVEPARRRRWLPVALTAAAAAGLLVLTVVRPPVQSPTDVREASAPPAIRHLRWLSPHATAAGPWAEEVWIDDVHHTVRLKSPDFDRTFADVPEPIALDRPGMPAEFAAMSPDVLAADQHTIVADLPRTADALGAAVERVAKQTGRYDAEVLTDLLSKPGLGADFRQLVVNLLLRTPGVGLLAAPAQDFSGRSGSDYTADVGPGALSFIIDMNTNTLLSMNKMTIVNQ
ncbi:hypothetical protein [Kutzneria buriramensis]|uniref:Uncharacterized protein n=1 Tax=Kutzneria buriramensis TaxID=1045776 RepID=A0A3E0HFL7_9PSEU|nr:hypothetical protein [Kutzneria buriramensis]REH44595.1 hypothetical protein BCF44_10875 [Kutzneria buriramensis]